MRAAVFTTQGKFTLPSFSFFSGVNSGQLLESGESGYVGRDAIVQVLQGIDPELYAVDGSAPGAVSQALSVQGQVLAQDTSAVVLAAGSAYLSVGHSGIVSCQAAGSALHSAAVLAVTLSGVVVNDGVIDRNNAGLSVDLQATLAALRVFNTGASPGRGGCPSHRLRWRSDLGADRQFRRNHRRADRDQRPERHEIDKRRRYHRELGSDPAGCKCGDLGRCCGLASQQRADREGCGDGGWRRCHHQPERADRR